MINKEWKSDVWKLLEDQFDYSLKLMTAITIKDGELSKNFLYPYGFSKAGYSFSFTDKTGYDNKPRFSFCFNVYSYPDLENQIHKNYTVFTDNRYKPSVIEREFSCSNIGLQGRETMTNPTADTYFWSIRLKALNGSIRLDKKIISVFKSNDEFTVTKEGGITQIAFGDMNYYIGCDCDYEIGLYDNEIAMENSISAGKLEHNKSGHYLVVLHKLELKAKEEIDIDFRLSNRKQGIKEVSDKLEDILAEIKNKWNRWFLSLPAPDFQSDREAKAYYKSWWVVKLNYYKHPEWGYSVIEALPVYKGVWQWGLPAVEWCSELNSEYTSVWIKKALELMIDNQREDGYITHAIYIDDKIPGERWSKGDGIVQTPHIPWVALRYYESTGDKAFLEYIAGPLKRYYDYLCKKRDGNFKNIGLWAITASFDCGLDTNPLFERVTYGEEGVVEKYCYPAIFGAEKCRYEQAMGKIEKITGGQPDIWYERSEKTLAAMNKYLWDDSKKWYGVRHEDGTLDCRIGIDGLFPLVYHLIDGQKAETVKENFKELIGPYGIRTFSPKERGFRGDIYWRGPAWPMSASLAMECCRFYYNDLLEAVYDSVINMALKYPSIWECLNADNGDPARSDHGFLNTPCVASNVGAGGIIASIFIKYGYSMYGYDQSSIIKNPG